MNELSESMRAPGAFALNGDVGLLSERTRVKRVYGTVQRLPRPHEYGLPKHQIYKLMLINNTRAVRGLFMSFEWQLIQ